MLRNGDRFCDGCGQKLPAASKLSQQAVTKEEAKRLDKTGIENGDGTVTIDLCLNCRVVRANRMKHEY